jgi:hypothetical protein
MAGQDRVSRHSRKDFETILQDDNIRESVGDSTYNRIRAESASECENARLKVGESVSFAERF